MATPVGVAVNPNNTGQRYILWGNGRIDAIGGAPPATGNETWYDRLDMPIGVAIHVTDWATGAGYVLDYHGSAHPFGGAPGIMVDHDADSATWPQIQGVPYSFARLYVDWSWNPDGSGQGYVLDGFGQIYAFGGAPAAPRVGRRWPWQIARKLQMQWAPSKRAITMSTYGGLYGDFDAVIGAAPDSLGGLTANYDAMRDFVVTDWASGSGHMLDLYGGLHEFGTAPDSSGFPYSRGGDVARALAVLSAADPMRFWQVWSGGQQFEWISSTPPTVVAGGTGRVSPAASVTDTTRPDLLWSYSDPQRDSQTAWQVLVFDQVFVDGHSMTDPLVWAADAVVAREGVDPGARGISCPTDLSNGSYRLYVRAQDTAGQWSPWDDHAWTQNVPQPDAPTGLTAVPDEVTASVTLTVGTVSGGVADRVRFDYSDDGGASWGTVLNAGAVVLTSNQTTATDRAIPLGVTRTYRAAAYSVDPRVASIPSNTDTAWLAPDRYLLTAVDDPTIGGEVPAVEPAEWVRPVRAGVFEGLGAEYATVVEDGTPRARRMALHMITHDRAEWERVEALATSRSTLVYRDPFGQLVFCKLAGGDWTRSQLPAAALAGEVTPLRHMHRTQLPLVEVRPPNKDD